MTVFSKRVSRAVSSRFSAGIALGVGAYLVLSDALVFASEPAAHEAAPAHGVAKLEHALDVAVTAEAHGAEHGGQAIDLVTRLFGDSSQNLVGFVPTLLNFIVLLILIYYLVFRKLVEQNAKRHDEIKQQLTDATTAKAEAEAVLEEFTRKLAAFDRERDALMAKTEAKAQATSKRILEEARAEAEKIRVISIAAAEREAVARRLEIEREIIDQAITKAEAILVSQFSEMDQRRIVDDYVERVANAPLAAGGRAS